MSSWDLRGVGLQRGLLRRGFAPQVLDAGLDKRTDGERDDQEPMTSSSHAINVDSAMHTAIGHQVAFGAFLSVPLRRLASLFS